MVGGIGREVIANPNGLARAARWVGCTARACQRESATTSFLVSHCCTTEQGVLPLRLRTPADNQESPLRRRSAAPLENRDEAMSILAKVTM